MTAQAGSCSSWVIPEDAQAGGNGILIDGSAGDARFGGSKECIVGSTGEEIARRKPRGLAAGEAGGWKQPEQSGGGSQPGEQGQRLAQAGCSRQPSQRIFVRCESEVGRRPGRRKGPFGASWMEPGLSGASPMKPGSSGASLMDRQRAAGCAERRCKSVVRASRAEDT